MNDDAETRSRARVGSVLDDKWTLESLLGVGGMAAVYAARHRNGARGAVKLLHPDLARHREVRERFLREGYAANRVEHPGAVKVLDDDVVATGPSAGTAYLVMELLEGQSMQDRLERGPPMNELEFLRIACQILDVLRVAHARGVVHRDLKPENLFLVRPDAVAAAGSGVKILDFGLARLLDGQAITTYGLALGTPSFMSPEQAAGRLDEIDGRTDLFALAATGYRLRTGRRIHEAANAVELVQKMATLPAPPLRAVAPNASEAYARVMDRALAFRREDRTPDAEAMQRDVQRAISELDAGVGPTQLALPAPVLPPRPSERDPTTLELSRRDLDPPGPTKAVRPRRRSLLPWFAVLLFGAIGVRLYAERRARETHASPLPGPAVVLDAGSASVASPGSSLVGADVPSAVPSVTPLAAPSHAPASPVASASVSPSRAHAPSKTGPATVPKIRPHKHRASTPSATH